MAHAAMRMPQSIIEDNVAVGLVAQVMEVSFQIIRRSFYAA
jgi:uncharacterized membrane protein YjfL (UPF0719 family)